MGAPRSAPFNQRSATALILLVAVAASIAGIGNGFVQDDVPIIAQDFRLHDVTQWPRLFSEAYWPPPHEPDLYRPLTSLVLSVQFIAGGGSPVAVRLASYALYAIICVVVWRLARRMTGGRDRAAFAAALLFAAHPVHVEATALGVAQAELLMALFVVFGVTRYVRMRESGESGARPWVALAALYVCAALSKEQGLLLPLFLLASEIVPPSAPNDVGAPPTRKKLVSREMLMGYAALLVIGAALLAARTAILGAPAASRMVAEQLVDLHTSSRVATVLQIVPHWVRLLFWPAHLRLDYSPQEFVASRAIGGAELLGIVLLAAAAVAAWFARRRIPALTLGILWTALAIGPVSNLLVPTGILIAERTLFLPSVGVAIGLAGLFAWLSDRRVTASARTIGAAALALLVIAGVTRSALRHPTWRSNESLTLAAIADSPRSWRANLNHANLLFDRGDHEQAFAGYERAIALAPSPWQVRHSYAKRLRILGDDGRALEQLGLSLVEEPANVEAMRDIMVTLMALGRYAEARAIGLRALAEGEEAPELIRLVQLADSAGRVRAPAGSIRLGVDTSVAGRALRPRP